MANGIVERMIRGLFERKPKTARDFKYKLKYGKDWHRKAYPHKYTRSTGPK
jgi:hypothetical protein